MTQRTTASAPMAMRIAVIGAGWAGMAAALAHAEASHQVTVFEAARTVGGRARAVTASLPGNETTTTPVPLDNGQHILIGAYAECLRLMRKVGVDVDSALLRLPLTLQFPDGQGLQLPDLPPPWDAALGIARAKGWTLADKWALLRTAAAWRLGGFRCAPTVNVAELCAGLTPRLVREFIDPLCISALNTPSAESSGQVFLRVLHDSLFSGRGGSNLLLPRADLGTLFPQAAATWLRERGHSVQLGQRIQALAHDGRHWLVNGQAYDRVLLATPSTEAARLVRTALQAPLPAAVAASHTQLQVWADTAEALRFFPITTVYASTATQPPHGVVLPRPMTALRPTAEHPAQFVFDRGWLGGPAGLLAFVISTSTGDRALLTQQVLDQAQAQLDLGPLTPVLTVVEKRATFACTPGLLRPTQRLAPGLLACGDYVEGPYPATLEGAVMSGLSTASAEAA